jgi:penicillin-insensitive murein DD-endopeptidase
MTNKARSAAWLIAFGVALSGAAFGQDKGTLNPTPLPPLAHPNDPGLAAKELFGRALTPADIQTRSIGFYARGCLAGAKALPVDGETWQVMRLSRDRNWGHPALLAFLERFSKKAAAAGVWPGILVGDMSQPRGGPMLTGHASHQVGLDVDIWLTPMPDRRLSREEREEMSAVDMVTADGLSVDRAHWSEKQAGVIKAAAEEPEVERIFVNAAIKKALCQSHKGEAWMTKVRAYWGHNYHFHVRLA